VVATLVVFSALVIAMSLYGIVRPTRIPVFARRFMVSPGIWIATGIRLLLAILLWSTARLCRTPAVFRVLAVLVLAATIVIPLMGSKRRIGLVDRLESWPSLVVRWQGIFGIGFGVFVLWSIWPAVDA
jgi:hypothetical protein